MIRSSVMLSAIVLASGSSAMVWAAPGQDSPCPCPKVCVPNVREFGYFQTTWRQWPGDEQRIERINPKAVGTEVLPTPQGQEPVRLPQATPTKPPAEAPQGQLPLLPGGATVPPERLPVPQGELPVPPGGATIPQERPPVPEPPAETKPGQPPAETKPGQPPSDGVLPGLPEEPEPPMLLASSG